MQTKECLNCGLPVTSPKSDICDDCGEAMLEAYYDYIGKIERRIKKQFGTKEAFCTDRGYDYKNFSKKLRTVQNQFNFLNQFMSPLGLEIKLIKKP
jgi:primosomal protein N'